MFCCSSFAFDFRKVKSEFSSSWKTVFYITKIKMINQLKQVVNLRYQKYMANIQFTNVFDDVVTSKRIPFSLALDVPNGNDINLSWFMQTCFITTFCTSYIKLGSKTSF